jgi:excisionase family DNA binding protein
MTDQDGVSEYLDNQENLLTPSEVAEIFRVHPHTVTRWAASGKLSSLRTPGGHRRYYAREVEAMLAATAEKRSQ